MVKVEIKDNMQSKMLKLNKEDGIKILKSFGLGLAGFAIAFCVDMIPQVNFGTWSPLVYSMGPVMANLLRKLIANEKLKI